MTNSAAEERGKATLKMGVDDTGFLIDRLGEDCHALQFLRELTQNSIEAIQATPGARGDIVWDVDWNHYDLTGVYKLAIIDDGAGMSGEDMLRYINHLSASARVMAHDKNFGVGAKVAAATRNHAGLIYLSWTQGEPKGCMTHVWRDPESGQYGILRAIREDGSYREYSRVGDDVKHEVIGEHGTMVHLVGMNPDDDSMQGPAEVPSPSTWIARYLNTRYFRFPEGIRVRARQGWKEPRSNTDVNVLRTVTGQEAYLDQHAQSHGTVKLARATARWWILREEPALSQNSGFIASNGHMAALYHDELYEMVTRRAGVARLQLFGVVFGYNRVVIYVEPTNGQTGKLTANTARTNLLLDEAPLPWADWAAEFRAQMPREIKQLMEEVTAGSEPNDNRQAWKERLRAIRDLFQTSKYRPSKKGKLLVAEHTVGGRPKAGDAAGDVRSNQSSGTRGGRAGGVYALFVDESGEAGEELRGDNDPEVQWISLEDNTRTSDLLEDRASKYLADQNILQINADFRVFGDMVDYWCERYNNVPGARSTITQTVREWYEQALVETVLGAHALKDSPQWDMNDVGMLWSEEALTAAVLQRYHIHVNVGRTLGSKLGSLKERAIA